MPIIKEICSTGKWQSSDGTTVDINSDYLDSIVASFSAQTQKNKYGYKVPLLHGHPKNPSTAPAYGWLSRLWRDGNKLWGEFVDVAKNATKAINEKTLRDVSIAFRNKVIEHVGMTNLPAVAGLGDFKFERSKDDEILYYTACVDDNLGKLNLFNQFLDWLKGGKDNNKQNKENNMPKNIEEQVTALSTQVVELTAKLAVQAEKHSIALTAAKNEVIKAKDALEALKTKFDVYKKDVKKAELAREEASDNKFVNILIKDRKLKPKKRDIVLHTLKALRESSLQEFSAGGQQYNAVEAYKLELSSALQSNEFENLGDGENKDKGAQLNAKVTEILKADPKLDYNQALKITFSQYPDLNKMQLGDV